MLFDLLLVLSSPFVFIFAILLICLWALTGSRWRYVWVVATTVFAIWMWFAFRGELAHSFVIGATADSMSQGYCPSPCDGNYIPYDDGVLARPFVASVAAQLVIMAYSMLVGAIIPFVPLLTKAAWQVIIRPALLEFRNNPRASLKRLFMSLMGME